MLAEGKLWFWKQIPFAVEFIYGEIWNLKHIFKASCFKNKCKLKKKELCYDKSGSDCEDYEKFAIALSLCISVSHVNFFVIKNGKFVYICCSLQLWRRLLRPAFWYLFWCMFTFCAINLIVCANSHYPASYFEAFFGCILIWREWLIFVQYILPIWQGSKN